jgi:CheY-like chemotaxis protein
VRPRRRSQSLGSHRHARADRARRPRHRAARGRAALSGAGPSRLSIAGGDPRLRGQIEHALEAQSHGPLIVATAAVDIERLRDADPLAALVVITARRSAAASAFDAGADAVLVGPLRPAELRARVRAIERRGAERLTVGPLTLHPRARRAVLDGVELRLPRREFVLLACLASAPGRAFAKAELIASCWGTPAPASRTLERHAARLRGRLGRRAPMLVTVWGVGYRLDEPA